MKAVAVLAVMVVSLLPLIQADLSESESPAMLLIDYGNGDYEWHEITGSGTYFDVLSSSSGGASVSGSALTINGYSRTESSGHSTVVADWCIFGWNGSYWEYAGSDAAAIYPGGDVAFGLFPEGIIPVETPYEPHSWTEYGGSSRHGGYRIRMGPTAPPCPRNGIGPMAPGSWTPRYWRPADTSITPREETQGPPTIRRIPGSTA